MIAEKLNMNETEAERWIVDLIRNAHFDARIDSENNQVGGRKAKHMFFWRKSGWFWGGFSLLEHVLIFFFTNFLGHFG